MKKGILLLLAIVVFWSCAKKQETKNDLPQMQINLINGPVLQAKEIDEKAILVLFQPDCDHCHREAKQIAENLESFKDYKLYFISSAAVSDIEKFGNDFSLIGKENVRFGFTPSENIYNNFGPIEAPSIYIYSDEGKLVKQFNGEVEVSELLKYI